MTKCIAIETSTTKFSLASYNEGVLYEYNMLESKNHAKDIYKNINEIMIKSQLKFE